MVDQGMKRTIFAGKIAIKRFSRDADMIAQVADGNLVVMLRQHQIQQSFFHLPLPDSGLLSLAHLVHMHPPQKVS